VLVPMTKVHVIGHRRRLDDTLSALYGLGCCQLIDVTDDATVRLPPLAFDPDHQRRLENLRYLRARLESVLGLAGAVSPHPPSTISHENDRLATLEEQLATLAPRLEELAVHLEELDAERSALPRHLGALRSLLPLLPGVTEPKGYETMALLVERRHAGVLGVLQATLHEEIGGNFDITSGAVDADTVGAVVVVPREHAPRVHGLLGREQVSRVRLPAAFDGLAFRDALAAMERRLDEIPVEIRGVRDAIEDLVRPHLTEWTAALAHLGDRIAQLEAIRHLGATAHTFVVSAWVPRSRYGEMVNAVAAGVGAEAVVEEAPVGIDEVPPVLMQNPQPARPFEALVSLLSLPRYGSIDPTRLMAVFLPLFFGMMLGDVGYGGLLLVGAWLVRRRVARRPGIARDLTAVLMASAAWTMAWGVVYGEFLGDLGRRWFGMEPIGGWLHREEAVASLLVFAIAVGAAHVVLGLLLGVWSAVRARDRRTTTRRLALLLALSGLFLVVGSAAGRLPDVMRTPGIAALVVGTVVLMVVEWPLGLLMGPLDVVGTIGNVLSYLRIAAIGIASVYLARIANELGATGPLWLGIMVAALFHALNLALGTFSPTIQALRLHYVEFFGTFYEEGGSAFRPFGQSPDGG
jgi:V/A-type H+/Na+-transporting ATPase subunit I